MRFTQREINEVIKRYGAVVKLLVEALDNAANELEGEPLIAACSAMRDAAVQVQAMNDFLEAAARRDRS